MKNDKRPTLRQYLEACRILDVERDIYVDGFSLGIAYCGTLLTSKGEYKFADALDLPMSDNWVVSDNQCDYDNIGEVGEYSKLELARELIWGMAGYCTCEEFDLYFRYDDEN